MEIDLTSDFDFEGESKSLIDMHGMLNLLNVINSLVNYVSVHYDAKKILQPSITLCDNLIKSLSNVELAKKSVVNFESHKKAIVLNVKKVCYAHPQIINDKTVQEYLDVLETLFYELTVRVDEIKQLLKNPEKCNVYSSDEITDCVRQFLIAVQKNSFGKYKIVFNPSEKGKQDYLVDFQVQSAVQEGFVKMPIVFNDVIRDTIANARKYTLKGGIISARIFDDQNNFTYIIEDSGMGIPNNEIQDVVKIGARGTNVSHMKTNGAGIGLAKACYITKKFSGKIWIDSEENKGTKIKIVLPKSSFPKNAA